MNIWDKPSGEMILFNTKQDFVHFINKIGITSPEETQSLFDITLASVDVEDEYSDYKCVEIENNFKLPIFNPNRYMDAQDQFAHKYSSVCVFEVDDVTLGESWGAFPHVVFMSYFDDVDRHGSISNRVVIIHSLVDMLTVQKLDEIESTHSEMWISNYHKFVDFDRKRQLAKQSGVSWIE